MPASASYRSHRNRSAHLSDLNRACAEIANCVGDTSIALSQIADDGLFVEVKQDYAKDMVTGFIRLNGATVGARM